MFTKLRKLNKNLKLRIRTFVPVSYFVARKGFTLIELLVVIFITASLTGIVTFNFSRLRSQQEISAAATDLVSKIRTLQTDILSGSEVVPGVVPSSYDIVFSSPATSYRVDYVVNSATTTLETVNLTQNVQVSGLAGGSTLNISSPFGKLLVNNSANTTLQITLTHSSGSQTRTVTVDGISGRVSSQ